MFEVAVVFSLANRVKKLILPSGTSGQIENHELKQFI
jgi:hypothetical protein